MGGLPGDTTVSLINYITMSLLTQILYVSGLGSVVVFCTTIFALASGLSDGYAAVVIVQAGVFAEVSRQLVRYVCNPWRGHQVFDIKFLSVAAQLELDFNSVERIVEYLDVPQERPSIVTNSRPPAHWPSSNGEIVVENLVVRYAPSLPPVLKDISFTIKASEKIGIVSWVDSSMCLINVRTYLGWQDR